jgi:tRNA/rRNA methyltransferase/tRNA (cytidine32/uridine32-2'-O)-methyltransferase
MKNMGLSRLRIAGTPKDSINQKEALERAVHAADVWEKTRFFGTLEEAAAGCTLLAGTTRRRGRLRKQVSLDPRELASWLEEKPGTAALVFGNERTGLEESELDLCNIAAHIPASDAFPSLNLSHAVQIYAYELFRALGGADRAPVKGAWVPLTRDETGELTDAISGALASLGFYRHPGRHIQERFLRDLISRAGLTAREGRYLADIFAKTARMSRKKDE